VTCWLKHAGFAEGILALNDQGGNLSSAQIKVSISPVMDYLVLENELSWPTCLSRLHPGRTAQVSSSSCWASPLLGQIAVNQEMWLFSVDVSGQNAVSYNTT